MARKAFLYTGAAFLIMMTVLIAANYFLLSEHTRYQSKSDALEMDAINNLASDLRHVLILDQNNALVDALSDTAFFAINGSPNGVPIGNLKNSLDPLNSKSETDHTNITKWFLNYANITLLSVNRSYVLSFNSSHLLSNKVDPAIRFYNIQGSPHLDISYAVNFSYVITSNKTFEIKLNQTLVSNYTLRMLQPRLTTGIYCVYVDNSGTGVTVFSKEVFCDNSPIRCIPRAKTVCY